MADSWDLSDGSNLPDSPLDDGWDAPHATGDDDLRRLLRQVAATEPGGGRELLSALSALTQQMRGYRPLSTQEQEHHVARYQKGLTAAAELATSARTGTRRAEGLRRAVAEGQHSQDVLIGSMFRLTLIMAREMATGRYGRERSLTMMEDLVAEAGLALAEALPRYNPKRSPAFNVYAGRVIRDRIRASLFDTSAVKVPSAWLRVKRLASTRVPEMAEELGRTPTVAEIKASLHDICMRWAVDHLTEDQRGLPEPVMRELAKAKLVKQGMFGAVERYEEVMQMTSSGPSLNACVGDGNDTTYAEIVVAVDEAPQLYDSVEISAMRADLMSALSQFSARERDIILHRFGWVDGESWTYAKLAPKYGVSAERVRQIEAAVLARLRGPGFASLSSWLPSHDEPDDTDDAPTGAGWHQSRTVPGTRPGHGSTRNPRGP